MELFQEPAMIWFIIGLVCIVLEFVLPGLIIIFFGIGSWVVALLLYAVYINTFYQIMLFVFSSIISLLLVRKRMINKRDKFADVTDDFIGKKALVQESFSRGKRGKVVFKGASWKAETESDEIINKGEYVQITGQDSIVLLVEPVNEQEK